MEMFNNVIDHSAAESVEIFISQNALYTWVNIIDNGIGIFKKIADYYNYSDLDEAILSLFKGKLTTDKDNHSGEGIFFTSRVMDHFGAISDNKCFSQDNTLQMIKDLTDQQKMKNKKGTQIIMALSNDTTRTLKEVFDMYADVDGGFTITQIPIKHICDSGYPVSRSQAKRLYFGFDNFKTVILDFKDVADIGQGFAHELFNVFHKKHPDIELRCINTNENIDRMIYRVTQN
ncbi:MAG: STAS-like domain-containing protein [Suilimivivens sp.]